MASIQHASILGSLLSLRRVLRRSVRETFQPCCRQRSVRGPLTTDSSCDYERRRNLAALKADDAHRAHDINNVHRVHIRTTTRRYTVQVYRVLRILLWHWDLRKLSHFRSTSNVQVGELCVSIVQKPPNIRWNLAQGRQ
jgi:hypothetical protein